MTNHHDYGNEVVAGEQVRRAAIEAAARALWDHDDTTGYDDPWERASDYWRKEFLTDARVAHDAMAPIIERAITERIEQRLLAGLEGLEGYDESGVLVRPADVEELIRSILVTTPSE